MLAVIRAPDGDSDGGDRLAWQPQFGGRSAVAATAALPKSAHRLPISFAAAGATRKATANRLMSLETRRQLRRAGNPPN